MRKESDLPEYDGIDGKGYFSLSDLGKFRPITVEDNILTYLKPKLKIRTFEEVIENEKIRSRTSGRSSGRYSWGNRSSS